MVSINNISELPEELLLSIAESIDDNQDVLKPHNTGRPFNRIGVEDISKRITDSALHLPQNRSKISVRKGITEVTYIRQPGIYDGFDIIDYMMLRNVTPLVNWSIRQLEKWQYALASRVYFFEKFKEGVKALSRLSRLTYARAWPCHPAWNILEPELQGLYPEALDDDDVSLDDNWCGLRGVLETFKEVRASGKTVSLDLRTPMATGMFGPGIPNLNTFQLKAMPFLRKLELDVPWFISDSDVRHRGMAIILDRAVNLEYLQFQWPYGDCMRETMAVQVMKDCTWPNLRTLRLLRSGGLEWVEIDSEYVRHDVCTFPYPRLKVFFTRNPTIRDLQLRNILVGDFDVEPVVWDETVNDSPAVSPLRDVLASLNLRRCSVALDTFKYIHEDRDMLFRLDEEIEHLGEKFGTRDKRLESHHPNIDRTFEFGPWLMQTST